MVIFQIVVKYNDDISIFVITMIAVISIFQNSLCVDGKCTFLFVLKILATLRTMKT